MMKEHKDLSDEELLRMAGRACAKQDVESLFPAEEGWKQFSRKKNKRRYIIYMAIASAAAVLMFILSYNQYASDRVPESISLFTAVQDEPQIVLKGENGFVQVISTEELDLTSGIYPESDSYIIETPVGKNLRVILPDSSVVAMNAQSRLSYRQTTNRSVSLSGEAYFQVKRNEAFPFIVNVGTVKAQVLGTTFNVRGYEKEQVHITLLTGSLALESEKQNRRIINPGEDAALQQNGDFLIRKQTDATEPLWTSGYFAFDNVPLSDALCELGRWYNLNIVALNPKVTESRIHFRCERSQDIDAIVEILNALGGFRLSHKENTLFIQ